MSRHSKVAARGALLALGGWLVACSSGDAVPVDGGRESGGATGAAGADGGSQENGDGGAVQGECMTPVAPMLETIHSGAVLAFAASPGALIEVGLATTSEADDPDAWLRQFTLSLPEAEDASEVTVLARLADASCADVRWFRHVYLIRDRYPGPPGDPTSSAVDLEDPRIVAWANGWLEPVAYGTDVDVEWQRPDRALGPARGDALDVVSLGNGGIIAMTFDPPIQDGLGADFVVFENSHNDTFLELAFVEVSSDGEHFARFDSAYLGETAVSQYGAHDTTLFAGLAGKYRSGFGDPFDLSLLRYHFAVQAGQVDLARVTHVRVVDIIGDGTVRDSFGHPIFDPTPTTSSGGFDLEAIGVLNAAP